MAAKRTDRLSPPDGSLVWFCSSHGKSTATDADDIVAALTGDGGRLGKIKSVGLHPHPVGDITNYDLSKFAGRHGGGDYENYTEYEGMATKGFDIVTPRHRWFSKEVTLKYVLNHRAIANAGYRNIYCSFCRS